MRLILAQATPPSILRYITKPIETLRPGDYVLARDEHDADGELVLRQVEEVFERTAYRLQIITLRSSSGIVQTIQTTAEHPVYALQQGWVEAGKLQAGDTIAEPNGAISTITAVRTERHPQGIPVYNFRVRDAHTYFVRAEGSQAEPVWVHNACDVHGNSLESPRTTYLYRLLDKAGNFLKWGITQDLAERYSSEFMKGKDILEAASGSRADMAYLECNLVETFPGPLNNERWAGIRPGG